MKKQEILYRLHQLMEARKKPSVPPTEVNDDEKQSNETLNSYESDMDHLASKIEWLKGVHADMTARHEHAKKRHAAGDHDWVIRNHYILNKSW